LVVKTSGDTLVNGQLTVSQKARFDQAVRVAPQGDISMGEFTAEP
jgi:ABC-type multidrug transport system ATPase subunit